MTLARVKAGTANIQERATFLPSSNLHLVPLWAESNWEPVSRTPSPNTKSSIDGGFESVIELRH